ncbi:nuclear transport factor 2 family protein [[Mycobacterium] burgundiense]|uniref:Nuclear transport factor 2 family protein n=1 Tax=[Mycobacterium] burgundiense TaxID=3064286 RepID=A0ABM9LHQ7_9MYCO|nr:nuclear transport factor 2 family protein [Mycolicibacterium sp. MU0053]CAJ1499177.1 nuclear transport factor 2 family protein [Mycolicibacterium sp. MU0053]
MTTAHPTDPNFAKAYSAAWTSDPDAMVGYFAADGVYTDVALDGRYQGHEEIARFHRFMLKFTSDTVIEFGDTHASDGRLYAKWVWSGSFDGPLRLRSGKLIDAMGTQFSVPGVAVCTYDANGKLTSHDDYWDLATVLDQAGVPIG